MDIRKRELLTMRIVGIDTIKIVRDVICFINVKYVVEV